jgi:hypothetical protein
MRKYCFFFPLLLLMVLVPIAPSFAACHAVGPSATGNGSGTDWNNRMTLPKAPARGDMYYLMDGSYGSYSPTTANSGTTRITIKKAQSYDFGRASDGCANDISAGWNSSTMGSAQANFSRISTSDGQGYYTLEGNGHTTTAGCGVSPAVNAAASDCGIKVTQPGPEGDTYGVIWLNGNYDTGVTRAIGWTIRYAELVGAGDAGNAVSNSNEHTFFCRNGCNNLLFEHNYLHESACDFIDTPWGDTVVFNLNHFRQNASQANCHGQFYLGDGTGMNNYTFSNNLIQDVQGTAIWSILNGGRAANWNILNNVIFRTSGSSRPGTSNGIFATINSGSRSQNINFIGNDVINYTADYAGALGIRDENGGGSYTWENNLFYNTSPDDRVGFSLGGSSFTEGHNSWLNSGSPVNGAGDVTVTSGAPSPFVNWQNDDFRLVNQNADWGSGVILSAPFNLDMAGSLRPGSDGVWDRGAFEFAGVLAQAPAPPTNLTGVVQ